MNGRPNPQGDARQRLQTIMQSWQDNPGRAPGGTGSTGLMSTDSEGYSQMLNERTEAMNLQNQISGKGPVNVRAGGDLGGMNSSLGDNPRWWAQSMQGPFDATPDSMPVSMRSLFQSKVR